MLGEALRLIRVFHDYKLVELAEKLQVSQGYLSEIENLKKKPTMELLQKYVEEFDISMSAIMFFAEDLETGKKSKVKASLRDKMKTFLEMVERGSSK